MALRSTRYQKVLPAALNRRAIPRCKVKISGACIERGSKNRIKATILDISIYGCRMKLDALLPVGDKIQIHLADHKSVDAEVIWQKASEAGCRFESAISPQVMKTLSPSS